MADLNVICNTDVNSSHIFSVKNISDCVTFYWKKTSNNWYFDTFYLKLQIIP